ncbi:unnamed protein product [Spirodela intermedia]|uniref:VQ domain-containing protein n=1 Tax=Spirodela intermedia TaxID=51605 RepID=A0A7I8IJT8_SPIIN|nr:unnamed protein product [Spirodela intermedia]CAA6658146.1 unnamed protein product [Spirodela intermedia]
MTTSRAPAVALAPASAPAAAPPPTGSGGGAITQPSMEGRIVKTGRKRSRASRKTPTTLLNTDTTNFRAMVQQFTGAPTAGNQAFLETTAAGLRARRGSRIYNQRPPAFTYGVQLHQFQQFNQNQDSQFFSPGGGRTGAIGNGDVFINPQEGYILEGEGSSSGITRDVFPSR